MRRALCVLLAVWAVSVPVAALAGGGLPAGKTVRPAVVQAAQQIEADLGLDCHVGIVEDAERIVARIVCDK
jgi:hypothetical protein